MAFRVIFFDRSGGLPHRLRSQLFMGCLLALAVFAVWAYTVRLRLPYMNQVPVFDADGISAEASMWARMWWDEGPFKLWFSTPRAPRSIETPTLAARTLYESWPSGAFLPIYLVALILGQEPSVALVNWINTSLQGLIALSVTFIAFHLALLNRMSALASGIVAFGTCLPILLSPALIYIFSQIYDVVTAVLIFVALFILLEVLFYRAQSARDKRIITALQLGTIWCAFFIDWLSYTLFAFWLVSRLAAGYLGVESRLTLHRLAGLVTLPVCAFALYLVWRFFAPGSVAGSHGISASLQELLEKILERMNLTDTSPITGFVPAFLEMHADYLAKPAFPLLVGSSVLALTLMTFAYRRSKDASERRAIFATMAVLLLVTVPNYTHMLILYQHTFIHRWAITKAMAAYGLIPFAILPMSVFIVARQAIDRGELVIPSKWLQPAGLVLAAAALLGSFSISKQPFSFLGRINREQLLMWDDIGRNTRYQDVVVSPVLEATPISKEVGASYKLVHHADNFADVDAVVARVCGDFNVVVALPKGADPGAFATREPTDMIDTGRIRLLRYSSYSGKAIGCP